MYKICWLPESMVSPSGSLGTILLRFSFLLLTTGTKRMEAGERRSYWPKCSGKPFNPIFYFCCNGSLVYSGMNISVKLACCGGIVYDATFCLCCNGKLKPKIEWNPSC